jgi:hypothetical protein
MPTATLVVGHIHCEPSTPSDVAWSDANATAICWLQFIGRYVGSLGYKIGAVERRQSCDTLNTFGRRRWKLADWHNGAAVSSEFRTPG